MRLEACITLLLFLSACATTEPSQKMPMTHDQRLANLQRAAELPWTDDGRCVVQEASQPWPLLAENCHHALEHERVQFNDPTGRCTVASAGAATVGFGLCVLASPQIVVGAVIVIGVVVVAVAIKEAMDAHELSRGGPKVKPAPKTKPAPKQPLAKRTPKPQPIGQSLLPPMPPSHTDSAPRPECRPIPVPHLGRDDAHNKCADRIPPNRYPGMDVLVNGRHYDALQVGVPVPWEIKTERFDTYSLFLQNQVVKDEAPKLQEERRRALECGYDFVVGVSTEAHKEALEALDLELKIVVTGCPR